MSLASVHPKKYLLSDILSRIIENWGMVFCVKFDPVFSQADMASFDSRQLLVIF